MEDYMKVTIVMRGTLRKVYGYDERIEKDVYMICTNRHGDKNFIEMYGCPQFVSYFVTV
jgi:hypothetical protein